jgi:triosephosphate isomerase (TIM)
MPVRRHGPFIAGNWKMNLGHQEARDLARKIVEAEPELRECTTVLIPPFTALEVVRGAIEGSTVALGAQNLFWEDAGAFTGEVSAPMLRDAGCAYVLVGHSERRQLFGETDGTVNRKAKAALKAGLVPIVCVGEVLAERDAGRTLERVSEQIARGLEGLSDQDMARVVVAYEPVWAIGTGRTASPEQAQEVQAYIRGRIQETYGKDTADCAIILYGGSVKPANSYSLFQEKDIDGFLVGGASLSDLSLLGIAREALRAYGEEK